MRVLMLFFIVLSNCVHAETYSKAKLFVEIDKLSSQLFNALEIINLARSMNRDPKKYPSKVYQETKKKALEAYDSLYTLDLQLTTKILILIRGLKSPEVIEVFEAEYNDRRHIDFEISILSWSYSYSSVRYFINTLKLEGGEFIPESFETDYTGSDLVKSPYSYHAISSSVKVDPVSGVRIGDE